MKKLILSIAIGMVSMFNANAQDATIIETQEKIVLGAAKMGAFGEITMAELYKWDGTEDHNVLIYKNQKYTQITDFKSITMSDQALALLTSTVEDLLNNGKVGKKVELMIGDTHITIQKYMLKSANFYFYDGISSYVTLTKRQIEKLFSIDL